MKGKYKPMPPLHIKHNKSNTRLHNIWCGIKTRCFCTTNKAYKNYGGRGIKICDEWLDDFMNFYDWAMANGYQDNLTIDRINNDGNYEPSNCRWVTRKTQNNNLRSNHLITYKDKTQTLAQWSEELGIKPSTLAARLNSLKWSVEDAFNKEIQIHNKRSDINE